MPPTFAYIMAFTLYVLASACVLLAAGIGCLFSATRKACLSVALGVFISLPGLIGFQILAFPLVVVVFCSAFIIEDLVSLIAGPLAWGIFIPVALVAFCFFAYASGYGIYFGYRVAWLTYHGSSWRDAILADKMVRRSIALYEKARSRRRKSDKSL